MSEFIRELDVPGPGNGDPEDVLRSLRRYVSYALGSPPWLVRLQRTRAADDERPVVMIDAGVLTTPRSRAGTITQGDVQKAQTFTVVCYPELAATAAVSAERARQVGLTLDAAFSHGLVDEADKPIGGPWRVPVYSFEGVPVEGPAEERAGGTDPYMHADVGQGFNVRPVQDAMDELRYTVVCTVPVTWWAAGRIRPRAPLAAGGLVNDGFRPGLRTA